MSTEPVTGNISSWRLSRRNSGPNTAEQSEESLLIDEQYADLKRQTEIAAELQTIFDQKPCDEWIEYFKQFDTCVTAVNELKDAFCDPQVLHRKMIESLTYQSLDGEKTIKQIGIPIKLSDTPGSLRTGPPRFGQHTDEILAGLGYSDKDIEILHQKGVC